MTPLCALYFLLVAFAACAPTPPATQAQALKIFVAEPGLYRLTRADLQQAGFNLPPGGASSPQLRLSHKGSDIPLEVDPSGDGYGIVFYANPDSSIYSRTDVYWLASGNGVGKRIGSRDVLSRTTGAVPSAFRAALTLAQDQLYFPEPVGDTHWFWQSLTAPTTKTIDVEPDALEPGPAEVQISLAGDTTQQHEVQVSLNDQALGAARWTGRSAETFRGGVSNLHPGPNALTLQMPGAPNTIDVALLDSVVITYSRQFVAANDMLEFDGGQDYRVRGFQSAQLWLYDISDKQAPQKLDGYSVVREGSASTLIFHDGRSGRQYLATTPAALKKPVELELAHANHLLETNQRADYIIIAPANFTQALQPLIQYRTKQGLQVRLVDIEQIYDDFSHGVQDPRAIRSFLDYARAHWASPAPRFVLLVGKASYDYRDNLNGSNKNLVPTFLVPAPHIGEAASDGWFVAASETDPRPELAIGRIPAKTPEQVTTAVAKILAYEATPPAGAWRQSAVFVTDDKEPSFDASADALIRALPQGIEANKIYLSAYKGDLNSTRAEIVRQWNAGALLMTYIGHGSIDTWAAGPLFSPENLGDIQNANRLPVLVTPTCLDGYFYHPEKDSITEQLLFKPDGGIAAGLVPTGLSLPEAQDVLMSALFAELFSQPPTTLGEAVMDAQRKMDASTPDTREVLQTFVLIGDPALKWNLPK